jgi:hypothetical protein
VQRSPITGGNFTLSLLTRLNWAQFSFVGNGPWLSDLAAISNAAARAEALAIAATNNTAAALALANNALVVANSASGAVVVAQRAANAAGVTGATAIAAANSVSGRVDAIQAAGYITNRQGGVSLTGDFSETNADFTYDVMGVFSDPTIAGRYAYSGTNAGGGMIWTNGRGGTMLKDSGSGGDGANKDIYNGDASYYAEARSVTNDIWPHFPSAWTVTAGSGVPFIGSPNFKLRVVGGTEAGDYHAVSELGGIGWRSDVGNSTIYYNTALNLVYIEGTTLYQSEGMGYIGVTFHKGPGDPDTCAIIPIPLSIPARAKNTEDALFSQVNNTPAYVPKSATNGWETGSHAGYAQTSVISTQVWSAAQLVNGAFLPAFTNATTLQPGALNGTNGLYFVPPSSTNRYWILGGM